MTVHATFVPTRGLEDYSHWRRSEQLSLMEKGYLSVCIGRRCRPQDWLESPADADNFCRGMHAEERAGINVSWKLFEDFEDRKRRQTGVRPPSVAASRSMITNRMWDHGRRERAGSTEVIRHTKSFVKHTR